MQQGMAGGAERRLVIDPVTRVEGHGKVSIILDAAGKVRQARLHVVELRGFERFIVGRPYWEVPVIVQRLCGICPVSHHLAACRAMDVIVGATALSPTADKLRQLMHYAQVVQSHALHFFYLAAPDVLFGLDAPESMRSLTAALAERPEVIRQGILMRKFGQEVIEATAGKRIHGTGSVPGGVNKNLSVEERDRLLSGVDQQLRWGREAVERVRDYSQDNRQLLSELSWVPASDLSLVREDGALALWRGSLRARDGEGATLFDHVDGAHYQDYIREQVRPWSYMTFPYVRALGADDGWYRVGPLARINNCDFISTPVAEAARQEFVSLTGARHSHVCMHYHWARMIELVHALEVMVDLLHDPDLQGTELRVEGPRCGEGVGVIEAPRGTLVHHYRVDPDGLVEMANLIVATTHNNEAINRAIQRVAERSLQGAEITDTLLNRVEVVIRAFDPCLSCATQALGRMRLHLEVRDAQGALMSVRDAQDPAP